MAEWLRRLTRNQLGFPRAGSNPADCEYFSFAGYCKRFLFELHVKCLQHIQNCNPTNYSKNAVSSTKLYYVFTLGFPRAGSNRADSAHFLACITRLHCKRFPHETVSLRSSNSSISTNPEATCRCLGAAKHSSHGRVVKAID